jgi:PAS domain S-box-containing protein
MNFLQPAERRAGRGFMLVFVLLTAGILTAGCLYYQNYKRQFRSAAERQLSAIADLKVEQLMQYRKERLGDANTFYKNAAFSELVRRFLQQPADADAQRDLQVWLGRFQTYYGYARMNLFDVQGAERLVVPDQPEPLPGHMAKDIASVLRSGQMTFLDFHRDAPGLPIQLEILVPIFDGSDTNRPLGVLVLRINPAVLLFPYIRQWPVPSETAETLLVRREGNEAVFLNELRFQTNTALNLRISLENTNVVAVKAVLGQKGIIEGRDYRGVPVIAAVRAVPGSPWFMVAREDVAEVFAPLRERLWQLIFTLGVLIFGSGAGVGLVWRQQRVRFYRARLEAEADRARLGAIIESSKDAIIGKSLDGIITSWNAGAERLYGYSAAAAVGKPIAMLIPPGQPDEFPQLIEKIKRGETVEHYETGRIRKNGERIQVSLTLSPIKDAAGVVVGVSAISRNITERKRADEALLASEVRYRRLFEAARDGILILDAETGMVVDVNPFLIEKLGFPREVFLGKKVWELGFFKDIFTNHAKFMELQKKEYIRYENLPLKTAVGRRLDVEFVSNVYQVNHRKVIQCNIRDITERKQAEEEIKTILRTTMDGFYLVDMAGRFLDTNDSYCQMIDYSREELLKMAIKDIEVIDTDEDIKWRIQQIMKAGYARFETKHRRKDGKVIDIEASVNAIKSPGGKLVVFMRDITGRKRTETELRRSNRAMRMISLCSQEMVRATDETALLQIICQIAVEHGGYRMAWVGFAEQDEPKSVRPVAQAGFEEGYLDTVNITWADAGRGRGPTGTAIRTGQPVLACNIPTDPAFAPWRAAAIQRGYASAIGLPLHGGGRCFGALTVYAAEPDAFDADEVKLLGELAGDLAYGIGVLRQQVERKQAEEALRESQMLYHSFIEQLPTPIFRKDKAGHFIMVNSQFCRIKGMKAEDFLGKKPSEVAQSKSARNDKLERVAKYAATGEEVHEQILRTGKIVESEEEYLGEDGGKQFMHVVRMPVFGPNGTIIGTQGIQFDITGRKRAEERIREQAALLDAANDAIYVRALDHTVTYWNDGAERLYGWTRAEALGRKIPDLGNLGHEAYEAAHAMLLEQGSWSGELKKKVKTGKEIVVFCRWTLLRDEQGRPKEILAINTDITEQKKLEVNFLRAQRMEGIGALAGGIAHDLNNILQPILMTAPILRETTSDPESREMLDTVENCAQRGADIIKQLLTFARGEPSARVPLPVRHLLNEMGKLIQETFPKNIQLRVNVPKDLWQVLGDATQIHQALMNLCVNARDAMPRGGTLTLAAENVILDEAFASMMSSAKPGPHVCVSVADTGTGIPPEHLDRIFDPFFTTKEIGKGTGLGLPTVLGIARGHGGVVRVNSQIGEGTTFELYLPASSEAKAVVFPERETLPPRARGELILVVDDEADVCDVIRLTLEKHGYRVVTAAEGAEAMVVFDRCRDEVRAVLTDVMMPVVDGPSLILALRQLEPQLPILGMTGMGEKADLKELEDLGLLVLLTKPFNSAGLLGVLHQALAAPRKAKDKP